MEKIFRKWEVSDFSKEYEGGFVLSWDSEAKHLMCLLEGVKVRLKDQTPKVLKRGCEYLPDFWHSLSEKR